MCLPEWCGEVATRRQQLDFAGFTALASGVILSIIVVIELHGHCLELIVALVV